MATTIIKDGAWTTSINPGETATFSTAQKYVDKNISVKAIAPTIGNGTVTITQNGTNKGSFTLNQSGNVTIALTDNNTTYGVATSSSLGLVKSGTDITVDSSGNVSVNDDSHNHIISNVDGLQNALNGKSVNKTLTNENLNNVTTPGFYNAGGGNTVTNKPSGVDHFGLIVIHRASGSYYTQIIFNDTYSYRRFCVNGTWGSWTQDKLTDTWRGIQNNLTSDSTTDSLSAAQGKALKGLVDGKAAASHTHSNYLTGITKSMVTDALGYTPPTTDTNTWRPLGTGANDACAGNDSRLSNARPASDVHEWAKASNKPTYSYSEILEAPAIFSGTSTPDASLGKNGDIYIKLV